MILNKVINLIQNAYLSWIIIKLSSNIAILIKLVLQYIKTYYSLNLYNYKNKMIKYIFTWEVV